MFKIVFLPAALEDLREAATWYEEKSRGLGRRFKEKIAEQIEQLRSDLIEYNNVYLGLSRVFVKKFPYIIYFKKKNLASWLLFSPSYMPNKTGTG